MLSCWISCILWIVTSISDLASRNFFNNTFVARRYGTYKLVQKMPGGEKLTGFTRILHRVKPDECMDEVGQDECMDVGCVIPGGFLLEVMAARE